MDYFFVLKLVLFSKYRNKMVLWISIIKLETSGFCVFENKKVDINKVELNCNKLSN